TILQTFIQTTVDKNGLAGDIGSALAGEPHNRVGKFTRFAQTLQGGVRSPAFKYFFLGLAERSGTHMGQFLQAVSGGKSRTDIIDEDSVSTELIGETLDKSNNRGPHGIRINKVGHRLLGGDGRHGD